MPDNNVPKMPLQELLRRKSHFQDVEDPTQVEERKRALHSAETASVAPAAKRMKIEEGISHEVTKADLEESGMNYVRLAQASGEPEGESAARILRLLKQAVDAKKETVVTNATNATLTTKFDGDTTTAEKAGRDAPPPAAGVSDLSV